MLEFQFDSYKDSFGNKCTSFLNLSLVQIDNMYDLAEIIFNRHISEFVTEQMHSWQNFVRTELAKGGGLLFKYIAKEDKAYLKIDLDKFGGDEFNPSKIIAEQANTWSQYWAPKGVEGDKTKSACYECMDILRDLAFTESANFSFSVDDFRRGLKGYNRTFKGVDLFTSTDFKNMPDELLSGIARAVEISVQNLSMFHQTSLSVQACLGKHEGMRTITLTSLLYSIWNRSQSAVRDWEIENMADFDTCKPGSSALYAALGRALQAELATYAKETAGGVFHDWAKFLDSMNISILLTEALETGYPRIHLAYAMQQHLAPRMIKLSTSLGFPWKYIIQSLLVAFNRFPLRGST